MSRFNGRELRSIASRRKKGVKVKDIAAEFGVSPSCISRVVVHELGLPRDPRGRPTRVEA